MHTWMPCKNLQRKTRKAQNERKRQGLFKKKGGEKKKLFYKNEHRVIWVLPPHVTGKDALYCLSIKGNEQADFSLPYLSASSSTPLVARLLKTNMKGRMGSYSKRTRLYKIQ